MMRGSSPNGPSFSKSLGWLALKAELSKDMDASSSCRQQCQEASDGVGKGGREGGRASRQYVHELVTAMGN